MSITITLLIQGLAFFAVAWLVMQFGWPNIIAAIDARRTQIADGLAAADRGQKALDQANAEAVEIIRAARLRAQQLMDQAGQQAGSVVEQARSTAQAEGVRLMAAAKSDVDTEIGKARAALKAEVAHLAAVGASRILQKEVDAKVHAALIQDLAEQITKAH
jgi:F-type H+-transporting ATPase subunit b